MKLNRKKRINHLRLRARDRLGITDFCHADHAEMVQAIHSGQGRFVKKSSNPIRRREYWEVPLRGRLVVALYEPTRSAIISVMPKRKAKS